MNLNTQTAKDILLKNNYTCVLYLDGVEHHSTQRGVKPLIDFLESGNNFRGFSAADKTVGAGAAHLYVLLGVKSLWANIISEAGEKVLKENNISVSYEKLVPFIINREGNGTCPIETAVKGVNSSKEALEIIKQTLEKLANNIRG